MLQATGQTFLEYLSNSFLPSIKCPPQLRQEFVTAIQQLDAKQYRKFFQVLTLIVISNHTRTSLPNPKPGSVPHNLSQKENFLSVGQLILKVKMHRLTPIDILNLEQWQCCLCLTQSPQ